MNNSESSPANEWNANPGSTANSPAEYGNALKEWEARGSKLLRPRANQHYGGQLQDRATRLTMESEARVSGR